ncbi:MAG: hypothetical protein B0D92_00590 [Spirochaeta sp. LUC14_002_19_P3]|nr:MAG: hypothetical protein B0D92_00590 [Spirochaeta sp. LUC14_002_19_P3]
MPVSSFEQTGIASWYGGIFHGRLTANGEVYDTYDLTCAHKTLPFGTLLEVKNLKNQKTIQVRVNDRGPFVDDRIIDLSYAAAKALDMIRDGTAKVLISTDENSIPRARFKIQIGAWKDLKMARHHQSRLEKANIIPTASLTSSGITRLTMENIAESDMEGLVVRLESLGYKDLLISQIYN